MISLLDLIALCFSEFGWTIIDGDTLYSTLLVYYGWMFPINDYNERFLSDYIELESEKGHFIVYWEDDCEQPRRYHLLRL